MTHRGIRKKKEKDEKDIVKLFRKSPKKKRVYWLFSKEEMCLSCSGDLKLI